MKIVSWEGGGVGSFGCVWCVVYIEILGEWKGGETEKKVHSTLRFFVYLKFIGFYQIFLSAD